MIVVGGTYWEDCAYAPQRVPGGSGLKGSEGLPRPFRPPARHRVLRGSGLRAAAALTSGGFRPVLHSAIEPTGADAAGIVAGGLGVQVEWSPRSGPVRFSYFTPLSAPTIDGRLSTLTGPIVAADSTAIVFGMVEAPFEAMRVSATRLVLDPQQPRDLTAIDLHGFQFDRLAVVANATETIALGGSNDVEVAAVQLRERYGAEVVVTKRAAKGALVTTADGQEPVGPFPTRSVWPIGSGDVFAATFALYWGERGWTARESAREASRWTAHWCSNRDRDVRIGDAPTGLGTLDELDPRRDAHVYLAAPFFNLSQRWLVELARDSLRHLGATVFSPFHDVGIGDVEVAPQDLVGLDESTSVLALLDDADAGTLFEAGYATSRGIPVIGYAESADPEGRKMLEGTGAELHQDLSSAAYRAVWASMGMLLGSR